MDQSLAVDVEQAPSDASQLYDLSECQWTQCVQTAFEQWTYQLQPVCIRMRLHEVIDVSVCHPVRYHCELGLRHCRSYQWQNVWVLEGFTLDNLLAEPLHRSQSVHRHTRTECDQ